MYQTSIFNITPNANILINVKICNTESKNLIEYENQPYFNNLCRLYCPTYSRKWSCPPYSPKFSEYKIEKYPHALLVLFSCKLDQFNYTKTQYVKIKAANSILKSRMERFLRNLENAFGGILISNGSCRLCNPCNKKNGGECKKPNKMRFSMESLGLNVCKLSEDYFEHKLLWYKDKTCPEYTSVISCLLMKDIIQESLFDCLVKEYTAMKDRNKIHL